MALEQASLPAAESEVQSAAPMAGRAGRPRRRSGRLRRRPPRAAPPRPSAARSPFSSAAASSSNPRRTSSASTPRTRRGCSGASRRRATGRRAASTGRSCSATSRGSCSASDTRSPTRTAPGARRTRRWRSSRRWSRSPGSSAASDGLELGPWVGMHTGPAVVGGGPGAVSLVGEARNVAVRLKEVAAAGQIVCSGATHRLIRSRFDCVSVGERRIRGLTQPIEVFRVQGVGEVRNPIEALGAAGLTPLTGRDLEITLLKDRWERAQEGAGQVVLLVGEPGLGKSRLVYTMKQLVREQAGDGVVERSGGCPSRRRPAPTRRSSNGAARGAFRTRVCIPRPTSSSGSSASGWKRRRQPGSSAWCGT